MYIGGSWRTQVLDLEALWFALFNRYLSLSTFCFNFRQLHSKILPEDIEFHRGCSDPNLKGVCKSYKNVSKCTDLDPKRKGVALDVWIWSQQSIAYAIWNIAEACHSYPLYEQHYKMICGIMRDSMFGFCEMKAAMVMSLVAMRRYDEAYGMIQVLFNLIIQMNPQMVATMLSRLPPEAWCQFMKSGWEEEVHARVHAMIVSYLFLQDVL